jgi:prepilin-type N-terminal cleavage/methylation domain-containing protein
MKSKNSGFTLIELIVVMVIASSLLGFVILNLIGIQKTSEVSTSADKIVSDLASQQTKAMLGAGSSSGINYGIYFPATNDRYILFQGRAYSQNDPSNYTVMLDSGVRFSSVNLPGNSIIFTYATGTISGYLSNSNSLIVGESDGLKTKTISINKLGVVTQEQ